MHRRAERPRHSQHFLQRLHDASALLPHVNGDGNAAITQRSQRRDQLLRRIKALRCVAKPERNAQRAAGK